MFTWARIAQQWTFSITIQKLVNLEDKMVFKRLLVCAS